MPHRSFFFFIFTFSIQSFCMEIIISDLDFNDTVQKIIQYENALENLSGFSYYDRLGYDIFENKKEHTFQKKELDQKLSKVQSHYSDMIERHINNISRHPLSVNYLHYIPHFEKTTKKLILDENFINKLEQKIKVYKRNATYTFFLCTGIILIAIVYILKPDLKKYIL